MNLRHALIISAGMFLGLAGYVGAQQAGPYFRMRLQSSGFTPPTGYLNIYAKTSNKHVYSKDADGTEVDLTGSTASGTVSSVAMSVPSIMSVAGSPVTTTGTLAVSLATQTANTVWCGPTTGAAATPTFRALVAADLPATAVSAGTCTACDLTIDAQGRITAKASGAGGGGTTQTIDVINATAATGKTITSAVANSGTNTGVIFNNSTALAGTTKLASFQNNSVEKSYLLNDGGWRYSADSRFLNAGEGVYAAGGSNGFRFYDSIIVLTGVGMRPEANGVSMGTNAWAWGEVSARHLISAQAADPTCAVGTGAGTGASCAIFTTSTDLAGKLSVTTAGADEATGATIATVTFANAYNTAPICFISPADQDSQGLAAGAQAAIWQSSGSTTTFLVKSGGTALGNAVTYEWNYHCIEVN